MTRLIWAVWTRKWTKRHAAKDEVQPSSSFSHLPLPSHVAALLTLWHASAHSSGSCSRSTTARAFLVRVKDSLAAARRPKAEWKPGICASSEHLSQCGWATCQTAQRHIIMASTQPISSFFTAETKGQGKTRMKTKAPTVSCSSSLPNLQS